MSMEPTCSNDGYAEREQQTRDVIKTLSQRRPVVDRQERKGEDRYLGRREFAPSQRTQSQYGRHR